MKWYAALLALLAAAIVLQLGLLAYALYVLIGILLVSRFMSRSWIDGLAAERECNRLTAEIGDKVAVNVVLKNQGRLPIPWLLIEDIVPRSAVVQRPPRLRVEGRRLAIAMLPAGGQRTVSFALHCHMRGYYQLGPMTVETGDLFGLHRRWRVLTEPHYLLVYPKVVPIAGYDVASRRPIGEIRISHRLYEDPTRVAGVRLYQTGDPLHRVHWRATARTGQLHSKIYEPTTVAGATILLSFHQGDYPTRHEPLRSELAITAAASLAHAVFLMGQQVGLMTNGRDAVDRIRQEGWAGDFRSRAAARHEASMLATSDRLRPVAVDTGRGPDQFARILETLARVELTDGLSFSELVLEVGPRLPRDATVLAILPTATDDAIWALGNLRRRGYAVTAVVLEYEDYEFAEAAGRLLGEGIDARQVIDEASLAAACGLQIVA